MNDTYVIPQYVLDDIEQHATDVERFLAGELSNDLFKAKRVPRGIYEQRQDGLFMVRIRVAGGFLWASQAEKIAELSNQYANGRVHVTTRQDIQFHAVDIKDTYPIMKGLLEVGLTPAGGGGNTVRNVTACSYSGICNEEIFDTYPYALAVTNYLLPFGSSYNLPRKFKIAFSGCGKDCALAGVNDLGFQAVIKDGKKGFKVYVAGGLGTRSRTAELFREFVPAEDTLRIVEAVKRIFIKHGDRRNRHRARLRFVIDRLGVTEFFAQLENELQQVTIAEIPNAEPVEVSTKPTMPPKTSNEQKEIIGYDKWFNNAVISQRQEGYFSAQVLLNRGDLTGDELNQLAALSKKYAGAQLRTDRLQNFVIPFIPKEYLQGLYVDLKDLPADLTCSESSEALLVSCKGAATCRLGLCRAQDLNEAIGRLAHEAGLDPSIFKGIEIHASGCPNNCGQHSIAPLGFYGAVRRENGRSYPCYSVVVGGKVGDDGPRLSEVMGQIPARNVPQFTTELLKGFVQSKNSAFISYWNSGGKELASKLIDKYNVMPNYEQSPKFYKDWGSVEDFSLAGRGPGECGAGIFELIAQELKKAEEAFAAAERAQNNDIGRNKQLLDVVIIGAGALLVTKGIEPGKPDVALKGFEQHFIDQELAEETHRDLLITARLAIRGNQQLMEDQGVAVREFLDKVQELYDTMDASFNFPRQSEEDTANKQSSDKEVDLRGVKCPMNFVHAKIALEELEKGGILEVILDEGEPIDNVPASFRSQGQEVISIKREDENAYRVSVRRVS